MNDTALSSLSSGYFFSITLFGCRFVIDTDRPDLMETFFISFYGDAHIAPDDESGDGAFRLSVRHENRAPLPQNFIPEKVIISDPGVEMFLEWEPARGAAVFNVPAADENRLTQIVCAAASNFIYLTLTRRGVLFFHASAVAWKNGAVIFSGPNGSGKSTLARSALARGARYLADDACAVFRDESGAALVLPGREAVEIADLSPAEVSMLRDIGFRPSPHEKFLAPPAAGSPSPVRAIYFLSRVEDFPAVRPLSVKEAAVKLLGLHRMPITESACAALLEMSGDIAAQAPAFALELGGDATAGAEAALKHVASII